MCMEAMSTVFDVVYQTSGQRKNHSGEVLEIKLEIKSRYWVEIPLLTKLSLVRRRVHDWRKSVPQQGRLLHSLLLLKFIME